MTNTSFKELNSNGVIAIAERFGYTIKNHPPSVGPCPVCESLTRHNKRKDKRLSVNITHGGYGWYCIQCEAKGDAVGFAAFHFLKRKAVTKDDWHQVHNKLAESFSSSPLVLSSIKSKTIIPMVNDRPDWREVLDVWNDKLSTLPGEESRPFIESKFKGCTLNDIVSTGIIKFQDRHKSIGVPWFPWSNLPYGHVLCFDAQGKIVSLHARALVDDKELDGRPKTRFPKGYSASGLLLADKSGVSFLRGGSTPAVVFTEGLTSTVAASSFLRRSGRWNWSVIGVTSGSASAVKNIKWPSNLSVYIWTDVDTAGSKYADRIREAVPAHIQLLRVKPT